MPDSTMVARFFCPVSEVSANARKTALSAPANAHPVIPAGEAWKKRMADAAPTLAPEDTPMISGEARGF